MFWGIPLTTKIKDGAPFRIRINVKNNQNDALLLQLRAFDRKRLVRKVGVVPKKEFAELVEVIIDAVKTTNPAFAGFSEAEANV